MSSRTEMVERALGYPYDLPREAYVLIDGRVSGLAPDGRALAAARVSGDGDGAAGRPARRRRRALARAHPRARLRIQRIALAAAPQVRRRGAGCVIPVLKARLRGFDVVYSAHVSVYGAVPATLCPRPGTRVEVVVTLLSPAQADTMLLTEGGNYDVEPVDPGSIESPLVLGLPNAPRVYVSKYGALALEGQPVALSAVRASGRTLPELSEAQMLERVAAALEPSLGVEDFIVECNRSEDARTGWVERLGRWAFPCQLRDHDGR